MPRINSVQDCFSSDEKHSGNGDKLTISDNTFCFHLSHRGVVLQEKGSGVRAGTDQRTDLNTILILLPHLYKTFTASRDVRTVEEVTLGSFLCPCSLYSLDFPSRPLRSLVGVPRVFLTFGFLSLSFIVVRRRELPTRGP